MQTDSPGPPLGAVAPASPELLRGLVDDAALFPPGSAPMPDAVRAHAAHRAAWYADLVGPLLCPASRLDELADRLAAAAVAPLRVVVVVDTGTGGVADAVGAVLGGARTVLAGLEVPLRGEPVADAARRAALAVRDAIDAVPSGGAEVPVALEVPRAPGWEAALDVVAEEGLRAKLRTGGTSADAFPTEAEVTAFVLACVERDVPFKCTAGLHHAVRHTDPATGFEHHGFLNVMLATGAARAGDAAERVSALLAERDPAALAARAAAVSADDAAALRASFVSYGTCSVLEPVEDLVALGLLAQGGDAA